LLGHRAEIIKLSLRVLIHTGYAQIKGNSFVLPVMTATFPCNLLPSAIGCSSPHSHSLLVARLVDGLKAIAAVPHCVPSTG
jgi:hypothetical protein